MRIARSLKAIAPLGEPAVKTAVAALSEVVNMQLKAHGQEVPLRSMVSPPLLIEDHLKDRYPFTCTDGFRRETAAFMAVLAKIALEFPDSFALLITDLDARFAELVRTPTPDAMYLLVRDLMGICGVAAARSKLADWLFPTKLEVLRGAIDAVLDMPLVLNSLLKFWYRWLRDDIPQRSPMKEMKHSADGIILFRLTAGVLTPVFRHVVRLFSARLGSDEVGIRQWKPMRYSMLVFAEIMRADYVMFGAFDLYEDPVLKDLLTPYIGLIESVNIHDIFAYTTLGSGLMETVKSLTGWHAARVLDKSPPFFDFLIGLFICGYQQPNVKCVELAVDSAKNITEFLLERKDEQIIAEAIARNEAALVRLIDATWDYHCNVGEPKYANHVAVKNLLLIWPASLQVIYEKLRPQIPDLNAQEFEERFQEIARVTSDLAALNETAISDAFNQFRQFAQGRSLFLVDH
jgi:hypothetical protein